MSGEYRVKVVDHMEKEWWLDSNLTMFEMPTREAYTYAECCRQRNQYWGYDGANSRLKGVEIVPA